MIAAIVGYLRPRRLLIGVQAGSVGRCGGTRRAARHLPSLQRWLAKSPPASPPSPRPPNCHHLPHTSAPSMPTTATAASVQHPNRRDTIPILTIRLIAPPSSTRSSSIPPPSQPHPKTAIQNHESPSTATFRGYYTYMQTRTPCRKIRNK